MPATSVSKRPVVLLGMSALRFVSCIFAQSICVAAPSVRVSIVLPAVTFEVTLKFTRSNLSTFAAVAAL